MTFLCNRHNFRLNFTASEKATVFSTHKQLCMHIYSRQPYLTFFFPALLSCTLSSLFTLCIFHGDNSDATATRPHKQRRQYHLHLTQPMCNNINLTICTYVHSYHHIHVSTTTNANKFVKIFSLRVPMLATFVINKNKRKKCR